jgi:pimeloyl-ACP methyl ester carboxylesterase
MPYRVILPASIVQARRLPVLYLLHGGGGGLHDWSNYSGLARFAEKGLILVADRRQDRYED